jgi:DNA-binding transcriptional MerR regulator
MKTTGSLRPVDLARAAGLSVQQVRNYEAWGFLPAAPRSQTGRRLYAERHLRALGAARTMIAGYSWQPALEVMRALHAGDLHTALAEVDACHARLSQRRKELQETLAALRAVSSESGKATSSPATTQRSSQHLRIGEVARRIGVRTSAIRFWESQGLVAVEREGESGYRTYDEGQVLQLWLVARLRQARYRFDAIRVVLRELEAGRIERAIAAVEERREELNSASERCARASATFWQYATDIASGAPDERK